VPPLCMSHASSPQVATAAIALSLAVWKATVLSRALVGTACVGHAPIKVRGRVPLYNTVTL
jgi:hypothetical protein